MRKTDEPYFTGRTFTNEELNITELDIEIIDAQVRIRNFILSSCKKMDDILSKKLIHLNLVFEERYYRSIRAWPNNFTFEKPYIINMDKIKIVQGPNWGPGKFVVASDEESGDAIKVRIDL